MNGLRESWWKAVRRMASLQPLACGAGLFLALYFVAPNRWVHLTWMAVWAIFVIWSRYRPQWSATWRKESAVWLGGAFLGWMWFGMFHGAAPDGWERALAITDALLLALMLVGLWDLAQRPSRLELVLKTVIVAATVSVLVSFVVLYGVLGQRFPDERLRNVMVNFDMQRLGQHPVVTGLTWAFAAVAAAAWATQSESRRERRWMLAAFAVLVAGCFCTQTRGALLGLAAGLLVLPAFRPFRMALKPIAITAVVALIYQKSPEWAPVSDTAPPSHYTDPGKELVARIDSGRRIWYKALVSRMKDPGEVMLGRGFWAYNSATFEEAGWDWDHPHGAFLSAFYHGGVVGLGLICGALVLGGRRCFWLARHKLDVRWAALLAGGTAMMIFDGHTFATLTTLPRMEPLIFWAPLVIGTSLAAKIRADAPPASPAEQTAA